MSLRSFFPSNLLSYRSITFPRGSTSKIDVFEEILFRRPDNLSGLFLIIVKPGTDVFKFASILPVLSAIFMAIVYISTRSLMSTESSVAIIFYYSLALFASSLFFFPENFLYPSFYQLIRLLCLGIMGSLGHYFISQAAKYADIVVISPFEYTSFIFLAIMGYYFYGEVPTNSIYFGGLLILISCLYIVYKEKTLEQQLK